MKENQTVRRAARAAGVPLWRVAAAIGVSEPTLTRWLRAPLQEDKEKRVIQNLSSEPTRLLLYIPLFAYLCGVALAKHKALIA